MSDFMSVSTHVQMCWSKGVVSDCVSSRVRVLCLNVVLCLIVSDCMSDCVSDCVSDCCVFLCVTYNASDSMSSPDRVLCLIVCLLPNRMCDSSSSYPLCLSRLYSPSLSLYPLFVPTQCQTLQPEYVCENGNAAHEANGQQFVEIHNLEVLDLRSNLITDEGDRAVSAMLLQRTRILRVDLCYNRIGPQGDNWCF